MSRETAVTASVREHWVGGAEPRRRVGAGLREPRPALRLLPGVLSFLQRRRHHGERPRGPSDPPLATVRAVKSAPLRTFRSSRRGAGGREGRVGERGRVRPSARGLETAFPVRLNARTARHILSPAVTQQHACGREHRASLSCAGPFESGALGTGPGVRGGSAAGRGRAPRSLDQASGLALVPHVPCCPLGSPFAGPTEVAG